MRLFLFLLLRVFVLLLSAVIAVDFVAFVCVVVVVCALAVRISSKNAHQIPNDKRDKSEVCGGSMATNEFLNAVHIGDVTAVARALQRGKSPNAIYRVGPERSRPVLCLAAEVCSFMFFF